MPLELYWRSTGEWEIGQLYKLTSPVILAPDSVAEVLLAVSPRTSDPEDPAARLKISPVPDSIPPDTVNADTLRLLGLPR